MTNNANNYILCLSCPDTIGVVATVSQFIASHQGWIIESSQHSDPVADYFFMRVEIKADSLPFGLDEFRQKFAAIAKQFQMTWRVTDTSIKKRVMILVSKHDHCLADLLYRWRSQEFDFEITSVVSNHDDCRKLVEWHGIPYHYLPIDTTNKSKVFQQIQQQFHDDNNEVMVLARYMQILPKELCEQLFGKIINIHHSFLPSFVGSKPYEQAFRQGVKLVGATCHYVTETLDAGPIIEQDVIRVSHGHSVEQIVHLGKDVEKNVLARGLRYHLQDRILLHENKTVVFDY